MRFLITLSYDGTNYKGYQSQPGMYTIQEQIENALTKINNGKRTTFTSSGRTDKGVHAKMQCGHADLEVKITEYKLKRAMNSNLPEDIHVIKAEIVPDNFHARYNVVEKTYEYYINIGEYNPLERNYVYQYNRELKVEKMKENIPNLTLSTDIIVGFPGETDEEFEDTLDVVRKVKFEQVYMFIYSRRVGTPADKMENQIPEEIKHKRFDRLKELVESQIEENNNKYVGTIQKVLVEGKSKNNEDMLTGRTDSNKVVIFEGNEDLINKLIEIKIVSQHMWYLKGEIL